MVTKRDIDSKPSSLPYPNRRTEGEAKERDRFVNYQAKGFTLRMAERECEEVAK
jgi:hypothetical protein